MNDPRQGIYLPLGGSEFRLAEPSVWTSSDPAATSSPSILPSSPDRGYLLPPSASLPYTSENVLGHSAPFLTFRHICLIHLQLQVPRDSLSLLSLDGQSQNHTAGAHSKSTRSRCDRAALLFDGPTGLSSPCRNSQSCHLKPFSFLRFRFYRPPQKRALSRGDQGHLSRVPVPPPDGHALCLAAELSGRSRPKDADPCFLPRPLAPLAQPSHLSFRKRAMAKLLPSQPDHPRGRPRTPAPHANLTHSPPPTPAATAPLRGSAVLPATESRSFSKPVSPWALPRHLRVNRVNTERNVNYPARPCSHHCRLPVMLKPPSRHCPHSVIGSPSSRRGHVCVPRFLPLRPLCRLCPFRFCAFRKHSAPAPRPLVPRADPRLSDS